MDAAGIDKALVRALLHEQHPDLAGLGLREVAGGWDNRMWRLGEELAVRLPRTPRAPSLLRTEQQWLPYLAPGLPLPVPNPVRVGEPSARFPQTWTVARWVNRGNPEPRVCLRGVSEAVCGRPPLVLAGAVEGPGPASPSHAVRRI